MALTEEQIKTIKKGDPVIIHGTFIGQCRNSDILCKVAMWHGGDDFGISADSPVYARPRCVSLPSEHGTSVPTPKYDPCRLFKKGDIVEMDTHARDIAASMKKSGVELGKRYTVTEDENNTGFVSFIGEDGIEHHSLFFWLKLVTPVEEQEPYYIEEKDIEFQVRMKYEDKDCLISVFRFENIVEGYKPYYDMLPTMKQAREAAEAEYARLNAEWRKEQTNE